MIIDGMGLEMGELLYEESDAKTKYDAPAKGAVGWKKLAVRAYILLLAAGLFAWFLASLIIGAESDGFGAALLSHLAALFGLLVGECILILTAFSAWGKFARLMLRRTPRNRRHDGHGARVRTLEAEIEAADENKPTENALRVYPEYIVVINDGKKTTLRRALIDAVDCYDFGKLLIFSFRSGGEILAARARLPRADLPVLRRIFGEGLRYARLTAPVKQGKEAKEGTMSYTDIPEEVKEVSGGVIRKATLREKLPMLFFMLVPVLVGAAILTVHFVVLPDMPLVFGVLFIGFGILGMCTVFDEIPVFAYGITPVAGGIFITALPVSVFFMLVHYLELSAASVLMPFTVVHAVLSVFAGFGPMLVIVGAAGIVNCIRFREKKETRR